MYFYWIFTAISIAILVALHAFFPEMTNSWYLLSAAIVLVTPALLLVVDFIKKEMHPPRPLFTRAGVFGLFMIVVWVALMHFMGVTLWNNMFWISILFGVYFALESRLYFFAALFALVVVILGLLFEQKAVAESMSIFVYLMLVAGVAVEIVAPLFGRFHRESRPVIRISEAFVHAYRQELSLYFRLFSYTIVVVAIVLAILHKMNVVITEDHYFVYTALLFAFCFFLSEFLAHKRAFRWLGKKTTK